MESHEIKNSNFPAMESHGITLKSWKVVENQHGLPHFYPCTLKPICWPGSDRPAGELKRSCRPPSWT